MAKKPRPPLDPYSSDEICEALVRHLEIHGEEAFEKAYIQDSKIQCVVICVVGEHAEECRKLFNQWLTARGFKENREIPDDS